MPRLDVYLNKVILVAIPSLFGDTACRPLRLIGVELYGLWLESAELSALSLPENRHAAAGTVPITFVPFTQIVCVIASSGSPVTPPPFRQEQAQTPSRREKSGGRAEKSKETSKRHKS